jgi:hypothetical protein
MLVWIPRKDPGRLPAKSLFDPIVKSPNPYRFLLKRASSIILNKAYGIFAFFLFELIIR